VHHGFARVPSMPNTRLNIDYANFDDYMNKALGQEMRRNLRRKFRAAEKASVIEMTVVDDVTPIAKDIYPLYLKVYERSKLRFEKLTERYFCGLGQLMPDKARFFVWHQGNVSRLGSALHNQSAGKCAPSRLQMHPFPTP
jgi:predicted N-acyltransferase